MEQPTQTPVQTPPPIQMPQAPMMPPVQQPPVQTPTAASPVKKSHAWAWILGGCLTIVILVLITLGVLGWWGAKKVRDEIKKYEPGMESVKENIDKMNKESAEWQQKAKELQEKMPNPEDLPSGYQNIK